jgi:catechol 2,3-dioxygenase-like lactoylglutathione lyase family enzyme
MRWEWTEGDYAWRGDYTRHLRRLGELVIESNYMNGELLFEAQHDPEHVRSLFEPKDERFQRAQRDPTILAMQETGCLTGIDHAVAITCNAEANIGFYEGTLGLELTRRSSTRCRDHGHLSYRQPGANGRPFLNFIIKDVATKGETGAGPVKKLMLPVACYGKYEDAYSYWGDRLDASGVDFEGNFDDPMIWFRDPDGLSLTIAISYGDNDPEGPIEVRAGQLRTFQVPADRHQWNTSGVTRPYRQRLFHETRLRMCVARPKRGDVGETNLQSLWRRPLEMGEPFGELGR